ncbi:hypothetical protein [Hymenobacter sp. IS2118]|uniref:hypothetical protein n=1 Tax=Hymenobacter sp. IS2118 TaxID=1505605 RepID=UPI0012678645|nr:hypothetical protein [Hymenobacter sp. IS2118]
MEKQFDLVLTNQRKLGWLAAMFVLATSFGILAIIVGLTYVEFSPVVEGFILYFPVAVALYYVTHLNSIKKNSIEPSLVTIAVNGIIVLNKNSGEERRVLFSDIASYKYSVYSGGKNLRIKRKDFTSFNLSDKSEQFAAMVQEFETAITLYQQKTTVSLTALEKVGDAVENKQVDGNVLSVLREKAFFEKKISTVVMTMMSLALVLLTCSLFVSSRPIKGSMFLAYSGYVSYATTWWITRNQRRS